MVHSHAGVGRRVEGLVWVKYMVVLTLLSGFAAVSACRRYVRTNSKFVVSRRPSFVLSLLSEHQKTKKHNVTCHN